MIRFEGLSPERWRRFSRAIAAQLRGEGFRPRPRDRSLEDLAFEWFEHRLPEWLVLQAPERARRLLPELFLMAVDEYHHTLGPLHRWALFHCLQDWMEDAVVLLAHGPDMETERQLKQRLDVLGDLREQCFQNVDFLEVAKLTDDFLWGTGPGTDVHELLELMPLDIQAEVEARLEGQ